MTTTLRGQTVLVTGATGFLGGALALALAAEGVIVRALVRRPGRDAHLRAVPNISVVPGDLTQPHTLAEAVTGCQVVFHAGAALWGSLGAQMAANRDGTRHLAEASADAGVGRFVHVSTVSVYGYKNRGEVTEATPPAPGHDPYGISKLAAERALGEVAQVRGLVISLVRPGMIYGPRSGMWTGQMFRVARRRPTVFIGDGRGSCYPIHVDDVVGLARLLATHPAAGGQVFNCTPDPSPTWREFLGAYARLAGHDRWLAVPPALLWPAALLAGWLAPANGPLKDLPDLLPFSQSTVTYSTAKARDLLGWSPQIALDEGIAGCAEWLRAAGLLNEAP
jgi:nucleoside-diphosphate-sugar epimerase